MKVILIAPAMMFLAVSAHAAVPGDGAEGNACTMPAARRAMTHRSTLVRIIESNRWMPSRSKSKIEVVGGGS